MEDVKAHLPINRWPGKLAGATQQGCDSEMRRPERAGVGFVSEELRILLSGFQNSNHPLTLPSYTLSVITSDHGPRPSCSQSNRQGNQSPEAAENGPFPLQPLKESSRQQ